MPVPRDHTHGLVGGRHLVRSCCASRRSFVQPVVVHIALVIVIEVPFKLSLNVQIALAGELQRNSNRNSHRNRQRQHVADGKRERGEL